MRRALASAMLSILLGTTMALTPAMATNLLGIRAGPNSTVTFTKFALTQQFSTAFKNNDFNNIEFSDITTSIFADNVLREVNVFDQDYSPATWSGQWECLALNGNVCTDGRVRMNLRYVYNANEAGSLMCEEVGHSVGLDHRNTTQATCMARPICWDCLLLHGHEITHLDNIY